MIAIVANGNTITTQVRPESFVKEENITSKVDSCRFDYRKFGSRTYVPAVGHVVTVTDGAVSVFGGKIVDITKKVDAKDVLVYQITCKDYTQVLDQKLIVGTYDNKDAKYIVDDIITKVGGGITGTNVSAGAADFTIEFIQFDYARPSDALRDIADLIGYDWWVDYSKDVHFVPKGTTTAAYNLTDTSQNYVYRSLVIRESDKQLKNTIFITGADYVGSSTTDKVGTGDGNQKRFPLPYKYDAKPTVTVGGVGKTVGIDFLDDPTSFDCLWNYSEKVINFYVAPASGDISVTGLPLIPLFVKLTAPGSVSDKGAYEFKIVDRTLKSIDAVRKRAQAELNAYADSIQEGEFTTYTGGLNSGDRININSAIRGVNKDYLIQSIQVKMHTPTTFEYHVKLANVKAYEIIEFLRNLLLIGEKTLGIIKDAATILNLIISLGDADIVASSETFDINGGTLSKKQNLQGVDTNTLGTDTVIRVIKNSPPTWVWGPYAPTGNADRNRPPAFDRGANWG